MTELFKVSIIGAGNISSLYDSPEKDIILTHAHALLESKFYKIVGFYDINNDKAAYASAIWGGVVFISIEDALNAADIVVIAVPEAYHYDILINCIGSSFLRAIVVEKPFVVKKEEANKLYTKLVNYDIPIFLNYSRRFMKEFHQMKNWIDNKAGNLICGNCFYGKGTLHNGSHLIDIMRYLLGNMRVGGVLNKKCDYKVEDPSFDFYLQTENSSCNVFFHAVPSDLLTLFEFDLMFEYGRVKYSDENLMIEYFETLRDNPLFSEVNYKKTEEVKIEPSSAMRGLYQNVYKVINNMEKPLCNEKDGLYVLNVVEQIRNF